MIKRQGDVPMKAAPKNSFNRTLAALLGLTTLLAAPARSQIADTILINGKILTLDGQSTIPQALAIRIIDLKGRTVIPGLIDSHMLFDKLPKPNFDEQVDGTLRFFRELNRLGIAGVVDPGGNNVSPEDYQAVFIAFRYTRLQPRCFVPCTPTPGSEFADLKALTQMLPMGFDDDTLRFNGIGERITSAMNNNNKPGDADKQKYYEIAKWAAERGITRHRKACAA
jgi:predicted amidohydrolase YtcJ